MKYFLAIFLLPVVGLASEAPLRSFRFVEAKSVREVSHLPPKLELTFEIMCNEELIKVLRQDWIGPGSKKTIIAVGALVRENPLSSCAGKKLEIKADAGTTFSGRQYEVSRIKSH